MAIENDFFDFKNSAIMAKNLDKAWMIYSDQNSHQDDKEHALSFLIYALDIKDLTNLNKKIIKRMNLREEIKKYNPEYIPNLSPKFLKLMPYEMRIQKTVSYRKTPESEIEDLFNKGELLDINQNDKLLDTQIHTPYLNEQKRAKYRVHIHQGLFYQGRELFDTSHYSAHRKITYAAYTLNANGELSVFKHKGVAGKKAHSSMNAGCPVESAGELVIKEGKLLSINTYSGHYCPSLFNVYRVLEYFTEKGVDINDAYVYSELNPRTQGLELESKNISLNNNDNTREIFYKIPAKNMFKGLHNSLDTSLRKIQVEMEDYLSTSVTSILLDIKDKISHSTLTSDRLKIARKIHAMATLLLTDLHDSNGSSTNHMEKIRMLRKELKSLRKENQELSRTHDKDPLNGRLENKLSFFAKSAKSLPEQNEDAEAFKKIF